MKKENRLLPYFEYNSSLSIGDGVLLCLMGFNEPTTAYIEEITLATTGVVFTARVEIDCDDWVDYYFGLGAFNNTVFSGDDEKWAYIKFDYYKNHPEAKLNKTEVIRFHKEEVINW